MGVQFSVLLSLKIQKKKKLKEKNFELVVLNKVYANEHGVWSEI